RRPAEHPNGTRCGQISAGTEKKGRGDGPVAKRAEVYKRRRYCKTAHSVIKHRYLNREFHSPGALISPGTFCIFMLHERMTKNELLSALQELQEDNGHDLVKELQMHHLELEIQNRELLETQQQLAHSRMRYADLYDFSPIGYACLDEDGVIE